MKNQYTEEQLKEIKELMIGSYCLGMIQQDYDDGILEGYPNLKEPVHLSDWSLSKGIKITPDEVCNIKYDHTDQDQFYPTIYKL